MQVMDIHVYGVRPDECHLLECICLRHTFFMLWGSISYNSPSHLVFLQGKVNSAWYIAQVVNCMLLPFLQQEGDVLFSRTTRPHMAAVMQCALCGVQQLP